MEEKKKGLNSSTIGLMIGVALFFDTLQALLTPLFMWWIVPPIFYATFWLWFKMNGLSFFSMKRGSTIAIGAFLEIIPGIDVIPAMTFTVIRIALDNKFKEATSNAIIERVVKRTTKSEDV